MNERRARGRPVQGISLAGLIALAVLATGSASAQLPIEEVGGVERLPRPRSPHWVWVSDALLARTALVDLDSGRMLGVLDGGWGLTAALFPRTRPEIYVPETHYSRGSRGERTDLITIYDAVSLAPNGEVILPPKRAFNPLPSGNHALSDDDRFIAVFNFTPATSLSIVDIERRRFVGEIPTPGCSLVYAGGPRRFLMLCGDGAALIVTLDEEGRERSKLRTRRFFDPQQDPVSEKAARWRDRWIFVSFDGLVHEIVLSTPEPRFPQPWSLLDERDREGSWRIGGAQHLAIHEASGRLYSLVHQGDRDTHKDAGTELWVYDLESHERLQRIELKSPGFTFMGISMEFGQGWIWPFNRLYDWLADATVSRVGVGEIAVTQDEAPLLVTGANFTGSLAIYDALSGEFRKRVVTGNMTTLILQAPWASTRVAGR